MRRREIAAPAPGAIPPEIAVGKCVEIWGKDNNPGTAHSRFSFARIAYASSVGLRPGTQAYNHAFKGGAPWSIAYMIANGRADQVEHRLKAAGVAMADIPRLQRAAEAWVEEREIRRG